MQGAQAEVSRTFASAHDSPCGSFMAISPLIRSKEDGQLRINPDFDYVKRFYLVASGPGNDNIVPAGETRDFAWTVPAEENHLGDLLVSELRASFTGGGGTSVQRIFVELHSLQTDKLFSNAPIVNDLMFGDGFQNCCIPCCFLLQATNTMIVRVTNTEAVAINCTFTAVGKRFLPYHYPELRAKYLAYWNQIPCTPYFLTLDRQQLDLAAGATETVSMTVPGGGDFEAMWPRASVIAGAGTDPDTDILISVAEGVGRRWESEPMPLGLQASVSRPVAGFANAGLYAAAQACPCPAPTQLFKRNTRVRVTFTNNGAVPALIRYTIAGCMHYVSECAPGRSLDRARSLEPTVGPMLIQEERCPPYVQMQPVPGRGFQPIPGQGPARPMPAAVPGYGYVPAPPGGAGGSYAANPGGPMSYVQKYYTLDANGRPVPSQPGAGSHYLGGLPPAGPPTQFRRL